MNATSVTHRLYTEQPGEMALDPDVWRVIIPKFTRKGPKRVEVRHKSKRHLTTDNKQAARANDQPTTNSLEYESLRTQCNLPGAEDVEASNNRMIAVELVV